MIVEQLNSLLVTHDVDSNEYRISDYLLSHYDYIADQKVNDIIQILNISKSTLVRFCKHLGYNNFTEVQYQLINEKNDENNYHIDCKLDDHFKELIPLFKNKQRIIIIGENDYIAALLVYKDIFKNIGVELCFKLNGESNMKVLNEFDVSSNDLVLYVSLHYSNLELLKNYFDAYTKVIDYLKDKDIDFVYVGKVAMMKENEDYYIEIKNHDTIADNVNDLCRIMENIYYILEND